MDFSRRKGISSSTKRFFFNYVKNGTSLKKGINLKAEKRLSQNNLNATFTKWGHFYIEKCGARNLIFALKGPWDMSKKTFLKIPMFTFLAFIFLFFPLI